MKSQLLVLAEHLNRGNEVTRDSAWERLGIQNLTARLSELTAMGFDIVKTVHKTTGPRGRKVRVMSWSFRHTFNPGDIAEVARDIGTYIPLRGKVGKVAEVFLSHAQATVFIEGVGYRRLAFRALKRITHKPGAAVRIDPNVPLVIGDHYHSCNSYLLHTPEAGVTLVAHASLILPAACGDVAA